MDILAGAMSTELLHYPVLVLSSDVLMMNARHIGVDDKDMMYVILCRRLDG